MSACHLCPSMTFGSTGTYPKLTADLGTMQAVVASPLVEDDIAVGVGTKGHGVHGRSARSLVLPRA